LWCEHYYEVVSENILYESLTPPIENATKIKIGDVEYTIRNIVHSPETGKTTYILGPSSQISDEITLQQESARRESMLRLREQRKAEVEKNKSYRQRVEDEIRKPWWKIW